MCAAGVDEHQSSQRLRGASYEATAFDGAGDVVAIAYSAKRIVLGPNGESQQAFVIQSSDAGATWSCLPLVRTAWSCFRYWGFPVWPPEYIETVTIQRNGVSIRFRDEWVMFEPGGESLWTGSRSSRGLWTVKRVRLMDYDHSDDSQPPRAISVALPSGFRPPPVELLEHLASRLAVDERARTFDRFGWMLALPAGAATVLLGPSWWLLIVIVALLVGLGLVSILVERRRHRRTVSLP